MDQIHDENMELEILKGSVENTNDAFITIDENHKVLFFNRAAEKIFGYSRDEVVGHSLDTIMTSECSLNHRQAIDNYIKTRAPKPIIHVTEVVASRKNGEKFPAGISFSVSRVDGRLYFTGIVRDLTETRALQEKIAKAERLAALGKFVAEITHEIKNPLMMIGGFACQLIRKTQDEKSLKKLNIIENEVLRLENLIKELREYYLPRILKDEEIDIDSLLQEVYYQIKDDCKTKEIHIGYKKARESLFIKGDRDRLKQVFLNLVNNSLEAMENGGNISIRSQLNGDKVEITIADDGCGIPEEYKKKVFSPFFTTKKHGTGLGLSISKNIIEDHNGSSFTFKSVEGKGVVFKITMPAHSAPLEDSKEKNGKGNL